jgi:hypothetical protein
MNFRPTAVDAYLVLGTANESFECELRSLALTPSPDWINTLCPAGSWPDVDWTLDLAYLAGNNTADPETGEVAQSLDDYLFEHYGEQQNFVAWPYGQSQRGYTGLCSLAPGPIGGTQSEWPDLGVNLPVYGQPSSVAPDTSVAVAVQGFRTQAAVTQQRRVLMTRAGRDRSLVRW